MNEILEVAKTFGVPTALVIFFVWWSYGREKAMTERIISTEAYIRDTLAALITGATKAIDRVSDAMEKCERK